MGRTVVGHLLRVVMTDTRDLEQQCLAIVMAALSQQISRRLTEGPNYVERKYGWYEVTGIALQDSFPATTVCISIQYSENRAITSLERFDVWDQEAPQSNPRIGPDVAPAVVLTNLEEWVATEAYFLPREHKS